MRKKNKWKKLLLFFILVLVTGIGLWQESIETQVNGAEKIQGKVTLRLIFTTDLHGQVTSKDYEQGTDYHAGGLAQAYDLILQAREEAGEEYSFTFDLGDVLYDVTTEYIMGQDKEILQPIYEAMSYIGYDAITLGNHDFDYGKDYIVNQLVQSGLEEKTVVSNLFDSISGENVFLENMLITRELEISSGQKAKITVGIIGETIPVLSSKTESYKGVWKTEDIVANVEKQAAALKEQGADLVVVLSHSGLGSEQPMVNAKNVSYALTKIPEVDVVLCGHEHNIFPGEGTDLSYTGLSRLDAKSGLVNGKTLIMASDRGRSIGIADITLMQKNKNDWSVVEQKAEVRKVSDYKPTEQEQISHLLTDWDKELSAYAEEEIAKVKEGEVLHNYFGMVEDNAALQLVNEAKISYTMHYISTKNQKYKDYPVIAASSYYSYGVNDATEYIHIEDSVTEASLSSIVPYNQYIGIYEITGAQLREWLEWTASAYVQTNGEDALVFDDDMLQVMKTTELLPLVKAEWEQKLNQFYIFDGIYYEIDPYYPARYSVDGVKINESHRVVRLKYNGKHIEDTDVFVLACDLITQPAPVNNWADSQKIYSSYNKVQDKLTEYLLLNARLGEIEVQADNNWSVALHNEYRYILPVSVKAGELSKEADWYEGLVLERGEKDYYAAKSLYKGIDVNGPTIVVSPLVTGYSRKPYEVLVQVSDESQIFHIKYCNGERSANAAEWEKAKTLSDGKIKIQSNDFYTIMAEDVYGNRSVYTFLVNNIVQDILDVPEINTYTNRKSEISGTAESSITVVIETENGIYETKTLANGVFSCAIPSQESGKVVTVYTKDTVKDKETGEERVLMSERVEVKVKRTGANQPTVHSFANNDTLLSGNTNDTDAMVVVLVDNVVYVPRNGGKELFLSADEFEHDQNEYIIVETDYIKQENNNFSIMISSQPIGKTLQVYSIDHLGRRSRVTTVSVQDAAPEAPQVYDIAHVEKQIKGVVTTTQKDQKATVYITIGKRTYKIQADETGYFCLNFQEQLKQKQRITVVAEDVRNGVPCRSVETVVTVMDVMRYDDGHSRFVLEDVTTKSNTISGKYLPNTEVYISIPKTSGNQLITVQTDKNGEFSYKLIRKLRENDAVYVFARYASNGTFADVSKLTVYAEGKGENTSLASAN